MASAKRRRRGTAEKGDSVSDRMAEWVGLGHRLNVASPQKWAEIVKTVTALVEGQEAIAAADRWLILRADRPSKRYTA